jgi:putative hemolysin
MGLVILLVLIGINGVLAMTEIAVVSARKSRLKELAGQGSLGAKAALELAEHPNHFLSTIQIGITLVGILAGTYSGAILAEPLSEWLVLAPVAWRMPLAVGLVVVGLTYLSLVFGELIPKRLGMYRPERIAVLLAPVMKQLEHLASPLVYVLTKSIEVVTDWLPIDVSSRQAITESEIKLMIEEGTQAGVIEQGETEILHQALELGVRPVTSIMTTRTEVVWFDVNKSIKDYLKELTGKGPSRFPVCDGDLDHVVGVVHIRDLLVHFGERKRTDWQSFMREPVFAHEGMSALKVFELFKTSSNHVAVVVDEYGDTQGVVTLTDILETIVGDLPDLVKTPENQVVTRTDGSWLVDGLLSTEELKTLLHVTRLPKERSVRYQTLSGFVLSQFERIPETGDKFVWGKYRFEVVDMDDQRIDKVLIRKR